MAVSSVREEHMAVLDRNKLTFFRGMLIFIDVAWLGCRPLLNINGDRGHSKLLGNVPYMASPKEVCPKGMCIAVGDVCNSSGRLTAVEITLPRLAQVGQLSLRPDSGMQSIAHRCATSIARPASVFGRPNRDLGSTRTIDPAQRTCRASREKSRRQETGRKETTLRATKGPAAVELTTLPEGYSLHVGRRPLLYGNTKSSAMDGPLKYEYPGSNGMWLT
ncbi:hypothetical protein B0H17DRAFT_1141672 [Mycena rosella]|uniref:Uncharacterized protein n=1 Tax=Mycena rosella TaxID=1033263 RepID=A0AAD7CZC2_MYCRO|nr:hypothetical protein B0H17DRAFT_1141672 [Mycena rosella]